MAERDVREGTVERERARVVVSALLGLRVAPGVSHEEHGGHGADQGECDRSDPGEGARRVGRGERARGERRRGETEIAGRLVQPESDGFFGTIVLTTGMRAATALQLTRIDIPFLLGTAVTADRVRAKAVGYAAHFGFGLLFALVYWAAFAAVGHAGWLFGLLLGATHGLFAGGALVSVLLPLVYPRMGSDTTGANDSPLLEPPGFMLLNYGRRTPLVAMAAHLAYGATVGGFVALAT